MKLLSTAFHPAFDDLSRFADLPDVEAARSRVGRHVARCDACAATVAEIRALGDAARGVELPGVPEGLWSRIEREAAASPGGDRAPARETPPPESDAWTERPALRPTRWVPVPSRRVLRRGGIALAAAAVVVAVLLIPTSRGERLQAGAKVGAWRFTPARPAPGARVSVRYVPAADERNPDALVFIAGFARPLGDVSPRRYDGINQLQDSLATLVRQRDGSFAGAFVLPPDFSAMVARLADSTGQVRPRIMSPDGPVSRVREAMVLLVGGDARGRPSLESLSAALDLWTGGAGGARGYSVSDTLIRYFPSEPIGYASAAVPRSRNLMDGLINWFRSGERQYLRFDRRFMEQKTVSVEQALVMIRFAHRIDEPGEVRKWTMRLAREHPDDPRALFAYGAMLSGLLSRDATSDSVRRGLPLADTLWERNGHRGASEDLVRAASTIHDAGAYRRWTMRAMESGGRDWRGNLIAVEREALGDVELRRHAVPLLRQQTRESCVMPPGKVSIWGGYMNWEESCLVGRATAFQGLSTVARLDGDPHRALALADSSLAIMESTRRCWTGGSHVRRGEALLALGHAEAAVGELAWGASPRSSWRTIAWSDSVGRTLRPAVDSASWEAAIRRVDAERTACLADANRRMKERRDRTP